MFYRIGLKHIKREKARTTIIIFAVAFSVTLMVVELGMLFGLANNASVLIDNSRADIWVSKVDVKTFDFATPFPQRKRWVIESVPGVEKVEEFNVSYTMWRLATGGNISVQIVGMDSDGELGPKLHMIAGRVEDIHNQDAVIIDQSERSKLDNVCINDQVEITGHKAKIVGFTTGMRNFTTTPFVFTSLKRSHKYSWITENGKSVIYYLVKVLPGYDVDMVRKNIQNTVGGVEAHTQEGFSKRTRYYWLFETGVGIGFILAAFLGLLVGGVIVSQMLYAATLEKLPEFALLKAMGTSMTELSKIVLSQSAICGVFGLGVGLLIGWVLSVMATSAGTSVLIPVELIIISAFFTLVLCSLASLVSIKALRNLEPAAVFRT